MVTTVTATIMATQHMRSCGSRTHITSLPALYQLSYESLVDPEDSNPISGCLNESGEPCSINAPDTDSVLNH